MADLKALTQATCLDDIYLRLSPEPLTTKEELKAFYWGEINKVRGGDKTLRLKLGLQRAYQKEFYKACLMGHVGVGKSTELSRLIQEPDVHDRFGVIRIKATADLNPANFNPTDVLLVMMTELTEQMAKPIAEGGANQQPDHQLLQKILDWFGDEKNVLKQNLQGSVGLTAEAGAKEDSLWSKILALTAAVKGEVKFTSTRQREVIEYRLTRLTSLNDLVNKLLDDCNAKLKKALNKEWIFIGEDFDKSGIPPQAVEDLFVTYSNIFSELRSHLIFNLPIGLYSSSEGARLSFSTDCSFIIADTPVYYPDHSPHQEGRQAVKAVLEKRVDPNLFEAGQLERLVVASGGNFRNLFALVNYAADTAILRSGSTMSKADCHGAIANLRSEYERRLGQNPFDKDGIDYTKKAELLGYIYNRNKDAQIPNATTYALLNDRAIQEFDFDGVREYGIHPLVIDLLQIQGRIPAASSGGIPGGSI